MGDTSKAFDMEQLMTYSDNIVQILRSDKDVNALNRFVQQSKALRSQCDKDFNEVQNSIQEYENKIKMCNQKAAAAESESTSDAELDSLQKELEDEQHKECILREDLRSIVSEIDDLERQRVSLEERRQTLKKLESDELRAEMKLSMYASVTKIIPDMDDSSSKISGHIVERDKKVVDKFEVDPTMQTAVDTCNSIWKKINL